MSKVTYNLIWERLLAARREDDLRKVRRAAEDLAEEARRLELESQHPTVICSHTFDSRGICSRCGYNASQVPA